MVATVDGSCHSEVAVVADKASQRKRCPSLSTEDTEYSLECHKVSPPSKCSLFLTSLNSQLPETEVNLLY